MSDKKCISYHVFLLYKMPFQKANGGRQLSKKWQEEVKHDIAYPSYSPMKYRFYSNRSNKCLWIIKQFLSFVIIHLVRFKFSPIYTEASPLKHSRLFLEFSPSMYQIFRVPPKLSITESTILYCMWVSDVEFYFQVTIFKLYVRLKCCWSCFTRFK